MLKNRHIKTRVLTVTLQEFFNVTLIMWASTKAKEKAVDSFQHMK